MDIRIAKESDAEATVDFLAAFRGEGLTTVLRHASTPNSASQRDFIKERDGSAKIMILALDEGRVIGSLTAAKKGHPQLAHSCEFGMGVLREERNKGIGKALVDELFNWARSSGIQRIELSVASHNTGAIRLYEKLGFIEEGRKRSAMKVDEEFHDIVEMVTKIEPCASHNGGKPPRESLAIRRAKMHELRKERETPALLKK